MYNNTYTHRSIEAQKAHRSPPRQDGQGVPRCVRCAECETFSPLLLLCTLLGESSHLACLAICEDKRCVAGMGLRGSAAVEPREAELRRGFNNYRQYGGDQPPSSIPVWTTPLIYDVWLSTTDVGIPAAAVRVCVKASTSPLSLADNHRPYIAPTSQDFKPRFRWTFSEL
jgi:hypothetical protein